VQITPERQAQKLVGYTKPEMRAQPEPEPAPAPAKVAEPV
jgi:hypothetical protein